MRSSIRSRSTSQNLSDDNRSLSVGSTWADSLSSLVPGCDAGKHLIDVSGLRLNFEVRHLLRLRLVAPINDSPLVNPLLLICSNHDGGAVVPKSPPGSSSGRPGGPETVRNFLVDLERRRWRGAVATAWSALAAPAFSICGCRPAEYWVSNARRAAATVGPIPAIPSSMVGPSNAIQSSLRNNNRGRRAADGLPG